jgi:hypothetical protein
MYRNAGMKSVLLKAVCVCLLGSIFTAKAFAQTPSFKVIAFFSTWNTPADGFLGKDLAHISFAHESNAFFPGFAAQNNFTYDSTTNWDNLNDPAFLAKYKVVMFLCDQPRPTQYAAFQKYMENGGAWLGFHVVAYNDNGAGTPKWPWFFNTFLGCGLFHGNTWFPTSTKMKVEDASHPVTKDFPSPFASEVSEWYAWQNDLRKNPDIKILLSIDPSGFPVGTDPNQSFTSGYYPIVWTNTKYKMMYCNSGHNLMDYAANKATSSTWSNAQHVKMIFNALKWLAGVGTTDVAASMRASKNNPAMRLSFGNPGLTVSRSDVSDFGISILDLNGNTIAGGKTATGVYSSGDIRLSKGLYLIQSSSSKGKAAKTLAVP